ncbi:SDR family oxidoreductase [Sphingomonas gilva]|uniref:Peroxisomal trans-2-enoyl-CoA reductase n=1 Tax=Sphingomonas gilva TaxID=2305907 RepID=A0A396RS79_9SPHN|nr:SDR family oxidoreductase [Sphingomonas gilva]RHW19259.1 SDR family oxidoreductase [Sphingomonas gilva]
MFADGLLAGKRILITGGGTGLGAAMAERFAGLGASLVLCGRREEVLRETGERIAAATGARVDAIRCDIRDPADVDALFDAAWAGGPVDSLVNNAGAIFVARSEHLSHRAFDAVLATSLHGSIYCTLAAGKRWIAAGRPGSVLSILSTAAITGRGFTVPTVVSKTGVLAMTKSLAVEWASKRIRLVAIAPGTIPTAGFMAKVAAGREGEPEAPGDNTLERPGRPDELADLATYLLSPAADYINGEMVVLDGGRHLRNSGVEDLLKRSDAEWEAQRARR